LLLFQELAALAVIGLKSIFNTLLERQKSGPRLHEGRLVHASRTQQPRLRRRVTTGA